MVPGQLAGISRWVEEWREALDGGEDVAKPFQQLVVERLPTAPCRPSGLGEFGESVEDVAQWPRRDASVIGHRVDRLAQRLGGQRVRPGEQEMSAKSRHRVFATTPQVRPLDYAHAG